MDFNIPELEVDDQPTSQDQVYARLKNAIMVGAIPTGTSLTMRGLAEHLDLSPTPIREALRRLTSESAIVSKDNRRMFVPEMTLGRFEDLVSTRKVLECHAGVRALPYVSDILVDELEAIDVEMDGAIPKSDYDLLTRLNHAFHRNLYSANIHQCSLPLIESIWLQLGPFQREVISDLREFYVVDHHKSLLQALRNRDVDALIHSIKKDIEDGVVTAGRAAIAARSSAQNKRKAAG